MTWPDFDPSRLPPEKRAEIGFTAETAAEGERLKAERATADHSTNADTDAYIAWATANRAADIDALKQFSTSLYTVASGSIDRARAGAELVQKASAAIAVLYTGALALTFSVTDNPLPARGVLTPLFLGLAVVLSTAYIAYLGPKQGFTPGPKPALGLEPKTFERLNAFVSLTHRIATARVGALRASVVALGVGLIFIAAPFVDLGSQSRSLSDIPADSPLSWSTLENSTAPDAVVAAEVSELSRQRAAYLEPEPNTAADLTILGLGALLGLLAVAFVPRALSRG